MRILSSTNVRRFAAACPVTTGIIVVAAGLWLASEIWGLWLPKGVGEARRLLGASSRWERLEMNPKEGRMVAVPQMSGPFQIWEGQWWRVPISGFHHGGLLHVAMNCLGIVVLGGLLEPRMGRIRFALYFLMATVCSMLPEFLLQNDAVGLSGAMYAMFGTLLVLRPHNRQVAEILTPAVVQFGFVWLIGCVIATKLELIAIANTAHFVGLAYGWLAGEVLFGRFAAQSATRWLFVAAHFALVPGFYFVTHPFWVGRYQWYLAYQEEQHDRMTALLRKAIELDPSLRRAWDKLSLSMWENNEQDEAWRIVLEGLKHNRSNEHGMQLAQIYWNSFVRDNHEEAAEKLVREIFGDDAPSWQQRLEESPGEPLSGDLLATKLRIDLDHAQEELIRKMPDRTKRSAKGDKGDLSAPPVDPDTPQSAAEGVQL